MKRILIFAAHPDDDILGCGGSMVKHVAMDREVSVVYVTSGENLDNYTMLAYFGQDDSNNAIWLQPTRSGTSASRLNFGTGGQETNLVAAEAATGEAAGFLHARAGAQV